MMLVARYKHKRSAQTVTGIDSWALATRPALLGSSATHHGILSHRRREQSCCKAKVCEQSDSQATSSRRQDAGLFPGDRIHERAFPRGREVLAALVAPPHVAWISPFSSLRYTRILWSQPPPSHHNDAPAPHVQVIIRRTFRVLSCRGAAHNIFISIITHYHSLMYGRLIAPRRTLDSLLSD